MWEVTLVDYHGILVVFSPSYAEHGMENATLGRDMIEKQLPL